MLFEIGPVALPINLPVAKLATFVMPVCGTHGSAWHGDRGRYRWRALYVSLLLGNVCKERGRREQQWWIVGFPCCVEGRITTAARMSDDSKHRIESTGIV